MACIQLSIFDDVGESWDAVKDLDQDLTSLELTQAMEYIKFYYQLDLCNKKKSGSHEEFNYFIGSHLCHLHYHL